MVYERFASNIKKYSFLLWTLHDKKMLVGERLETDVTLDARIWLERTGYHYLVNYQRAMWELAMLDAGQRDGSGQPPAFEAMKVKEWLKLTQYQEPAVQSRSS